MEDGISTTESTFKTKDGQELYTKTWHTDGPPRARLVFIHGFSDHCNFYSPLFPLLAKRAIEIRAFDQRGWGRSCLRSKKERGVTGPTSRVLQDITEFIQTLPTAAADPTPLFLMGHSMGGAEVLTYAATGPSDIVNRIRGFLTEAPFVGFHPAEEPSRLLVWAGRGGARVMPRFQMVRAIDPAHVSRDPEVRRELAADTLCHDTGTLEGLAGLLDRALDLGSGKVTIGEGRGEGGKTRLWIGHGSSDLVAAVEPCQAMFERFDIKDKEMKVYDGWYHKLHSEPGECKQEFASDVAQWILDRSGSLTGESAEDDAKPKL